MTADRVMMGRIENGEVVRVMSTAEWAALAQRLKNETRDKFLRSL